MSSEIRKWQKQDAVKLSEILNDKTILDNLRDGLPYPYTVKDAEDYINFVLSADRNSTFAWAVVYNGELAGNIGIFRNSNIHSRTAELGYYVGKLYWNKGVATEAVMQACRYIFENTDIIRIYAEPFVRNKASCRVLEKAGFNCEGTLYANAVKNGIIEDMKMFAKIKQNG